MDRKSLKLAILGLAIIAIGCVAVCIMDFPVGLLILLPGAIPHIIQIYRYLRKKER